MLNIKKELLVFFCACLTGVNVRAGYEILIFLRKMIIHNNLCFLSRIAASFHIERSRGSGRKLFWGSTLPGALKAKGGISDDSVGNSRTAYVHSHAAGSDRGCDPPDRRGYGKVFPDEKR